MNFFEKLCPLNNGAIGAPWIVVKNEATKNNAALNSSAVSNKNSNLNKNVFEIIFDYNYQ